MIAHGLEVAYVPGVGEMQRVECPEEYPLCVRRDRRNVCPCSVSRKGKNFAVATSRKR
jgi:hypothetical protein